MSSRITLILAGLFLLGAIIAGYWGMVLSKHPEPSAPVAQPAAQPVTQVVNNAQDELRKPVVVLRRDVAANQPLNPDDLAVERLLVAPAGSFQTLEQVAGRSPRRDLPAGTWLEESSFEAGGPLARMIEPGERALTVAVDEVSGAAGYLRPGDYVDVLVFLREETDNPLASAQVVVPALRVLSVGQQIGVARDGRSAEPVDPDPKVREEKRRTPARTVVLAVPEVLASRLTLAAQAGKLGLTVRSAEETSLADFWADPKTAVRAADDANRQLYRFNQLAMTAPAPVPVAASAPRRGIEIIRGAQTSESLH
ncbi:Flp pilus assembly protein CpaB [Pseudomonas putida]|uniref:Flp pilus assembly protein CpaB n=1 Tax=Pseudomonas putida TaxID=303 RepID=A0A177SWF5_PSEPU|nr:Flp pilus assembly protein CpaB [Pseudomonas putida]OAI94641.1 Flp pilus assembly protein CpaB [Pseudomonas putida]